MIDGSTVHQEKEESCLIGINGIHEDRDDNKTFVLGDTFLRNFYSVYDFSAHEVGLGVESKNE